jgi:steroid 5-alpha reductase family enzyme
MTRDPLMLLTQAWMASAGLMLALWFIQRKFRNASIADLGWCFGLTATIAWYALVVDGDPMRRLLVVCMIALYGLRLGLHILFDRVLGKQEDPRYQTLRRRWGSREPLNMFGYFQLQAVAVIVFAFPPLLVMLNPRPAFSMWELLGVILWGIALSGEAIADWQLTAFRSKSWNRDRVCRHGFWRYSRHPNYFFEWLHWWSYVVMAFALPAGNWWATLIGPLAMGWALVNVTGIPWAEAQALTTRGDEYRAYQRTTSPFIPWWPRPDRQA